MADQLDGEEKAIRLGCGFLFGLVTGTVVTLRFLGDGGWFARLMWCVPPGLAVAFAWLALRDGDAFWERQADSQWWWPDWWWFFW
jgi:hypothetical protein